MNFVKNIAPIFVASVLLLPIFVLSNIFDGHIWGPFYFLVITGSIFVIAISFYLYINKKILLNINLNIIELLMLFTFLYVIGSVVSCKFGLSYASNLYVFGILILLIFIAKSWVFNTGKNWHIFFIVSIFMLIAIFEVVLGFLQLGRQYSKNQDLFKITGTFDNSGIYANYLSIICVFALGLCLHVDLNMKKLRYLSFFTFFIIIVILPFTQARTSWLAVLIGIITVSWPKIKTISIIKLMIANAKNKLLTFSFLFAVVFFIFYHLYQYKVQSAKGRLLIYGVSLNMIMDKPVFGHGFNRFLAEYNIYQAEYFKNHSHTINAVLADNVRSGFNEFIQVTVELGLAGLLLFIGFIVLLFYTKSKSEWEFIVIPAKGALSAVLICCLFSYPLRVLPIAGCIVFILSIIMASNVDRGYNIRIGRQYYIPLALISTIIAILVCYIQWSDYNARKQWKQAIDYTQLNDFEKALPYYQKSYKILNYDGFFLYNYGAELIEINPVEGVRILEEATNYLSDNDLYCYLGDGYRALKKYNKAEFNYQLSSLMVPCKFYPRYQLFKLYCETNQYCKARYIAQSIASMEVKVPSLIVLEIKSEIEEWLIMHK